MKLAEVFRIFYLEYLIVLYLFGYCRTAFIQLNPFELKFVIVTTP